MFRTGFCEMGQCEGTRPRSPSGRPMKVCINLAQCECSCHAMISEMCELADMERALNIQDNPEYIPYNRTFWMPTLEDRVAIELVAATTKHKISFDSPDEPSFEETPTGRAPRGQLEYRVKQVTDAWLNESDPVQCTTKYIAAHILETHGVNSSVGAIYAVLDRWRKCGYCDLDENPFRFVGLTIAGMEHGLDWCRSHTSKVKAS
jgi:hypothetical protein